MKEESASIEKNNPAVEKQYPLAQLYFYLTEGCNLACRHCWLAPKFQDEKHKYAVIDFDLLCNIVQQARPMGLAGVKLTGGEPLMHPSIADILDYLRREEIGCTIESNGILCTPHLAEKIAAAKSIFISISLDGVNAETHEWVRGVKGCFEQSLQGIRNLVAVGLKPQIIMSVMRANKEQIEPMIRLAESLGAGSVKFNLIQPTERGLRMHENDGALTVEEYIQLGAWVDETLTHQTPLKLFFDHPIAFRPLGKIFNETGDGCGRCGILGILGVLSDGSYALCGIGTSIPELIFGNAKKDPLASVWRDSAVLNSIRKGLPIQLTGICGECVMKEMCLGSCIAQNYYSEKNLFAPFWYCKEAAQKDLFPKSRIKDLTKKGSSA